MSRAVIALPLVCLGLNGCVAPLLLAPAMIPAMMSSAAPAMGAATASAAARAAATRQQEGTYAQRPPPKFEPPWALVKKPEAAAETAR